MALAGGKLAGGNPETERVENDYYATNPKAVEMLLNEYDFNDGYWLEPCVGEGHIAKIIESKCYAICTGIDVVDRGYPNTIIADFLTYETNQKFDNIITNPPYSLATEFIEKSLSLLSDGGKCAMFLKIQFIEGLKRKTLYENNPPKYIYVFRNRMATWNNGQELDPQGKRWATTMCHAWFIWEKGSKSEPIIRWL